MAIDKRLYTIRTAIYEPDDGRIYIGTKREFITKLNSNNEFTNYGPEELADYPAERDVRDEVVFGNGDFTGSLGSINDNNMDISEQIKNNAITLIESYLTGWSKLDYSNNISQNEKNNSRKRFSVNILGLVGTDELIGNELVNREYQVVLVDRYLNKGKSDKNQQLTATEIRSALEELRRRFRSTNFGNYSNVANSYNYSEPEIEFNEEEGMVIGTLTLTVTYQV